MIVYPTAKTSKHGSLIGVNVAGLILNGRVSISRQRITNLRLLFAILRNTIYVQYTSHNMGSSQSNISF